MRPILVALACIAALHVTAADAQARAQMAVFLLKTLEGAGAEPPNTFPLGAATLNLEGVCPNCTLTVSNIGASGEDGVEFDVRLPGLQTLATFMDWQWWDLADSLPVGASFQSEIFGTIAGIENQRIGTWRMEKTAFATYESTLDWAPLGLSGMRIVLAQQDGTIIGEIPNVPEGAEVVMQVDVGVLDPGEPFQQAWIAGEGTDTAAPGGTPLPPGMESLCGAAFECEYHGWPALSELGLRSDGDLVQAISTDPAQPTGIMAVLGDGSVHSSVEEITALRLTFANVPEFQVRGIQLLVVPEPSGIVLVTSLMAAGFLCRRCNRCGRIGTAGESP